MINLVRHRNDPPRIHREVLFNYYVDNNSQILRSHRVKRRVLGILDILVLHGLILRR